MFLASVQPSYILKVYLVPGKPTYSVDFFTEHTWYHTDTFLLTISAKNLFTNDLLSKNCFKNRYSKEPRTLFCTGALRVTSSPVRWSRCIAGPIVQFKLAELTDCAWFILKQTVSPNGLSDHLKKFLVHNIKLVHCTLFMQFSWTLRKWNHSFCDLYYCIIIEAPAPGPNRSGASLLSTRGTGV